MGVVIALGCLAPACGEDSPPSGPAEPVVDAGRGAGGELSLDSFEVTRESLTPGDEVMVTALVTASAGDDSLMDARLFTADQPSPLVELEQAAPGQFRGQLTWGQINQDRAIDTPVGGSPREFELVVRDLGGQALRHRFTLRLDCPDESKGLCGGSCTALVSDVDNCMACGQICPESEFGVAICTPQGCGLECTANAFACESGCAGPATTEAYDTGLPSSRSSAVDSAGRPSVAFFAGTNTPNLYYAIRNGGVWESERFNENPEAIDMVIDRKDRPHIAFTGNFFGPTDNFIRYGRRDDTGAWSFSTIFSTRNASFESPSVAVDVSGRPHVVYKPSSLALEYAVQQDDGTWHKEFPVGSQIDYRPLSLAIGADGTPMLLARRNADGKDRVYLIVRQDEQTWRVDEIPPTGSRSRLRIDPAGVPHLAVRNDQRILLASLVGDDWAFEPIHELAEEGEGSPQLAFDAAGRAHVWISPSTSAAIYMRPNDSGWEAMPIALDHHSATFSVDSAGTPNVFYGTASDIGDATLMHTAFPCQ